MADRLPTFADYQEAYREGRCTPVEVARGVLRGAARSEDHHPPLRLFIAQSEQDLLEQAHDSAERLARGAPAGPLEGIPIAVKDEIDQRGYPTTVGTCFLGRRAVDADATAVARLRAAGALLVGKTNMHEIGLGATGINPHHGSARNPYDPQRVTGGSSSGSAAVVACGLCPAAIGADGGGSVRIPAALCGVVGIKPTYGRVSERGAVPLVWSLAHLGPLAWSLRDAALVLSVIAGVDPADPNTSGQPPLDLASLSDGVSGMRIGWCERWVRAATPPVLTACHELLHRLTAAGATIVELELEHLELIRPVQYVTMGAEMAASQVEHRREHMRDYAADTRLLLELGSHLPAIDYIRAQRLRSLIRDSFAAALRRADVLLSPMTGCVAPPLRADAESAGESDDVVLESLTAFSFAANLTGLPAISVPAGYAGGLPIGLQIIGRWWDEASILRVGLQVEELVTRQLPATRFTPL
jgi:Asp-tRNA(Asn)/Glu-tRNA(Gln) amidotransferase A subunit family amidase